MGREWVVIGLNILLVWAAGGLWGRLAGKAHRPWYQYAGAGGALLGGAGLVYRLVPPFLRPWGVWGLLSIGLVGGGWWLIEIIKRRRAGVMVILATLSMALGLSMWRGRAMLVPPYSDSAYHFAIVQDSFLRHSLPCLFYSLHRPFPQQFHYYHMGFHGWVTWLGWLTPLRPLDLFAASVVSLFLVYPLNVYWLMKVLKVEEKGAVMASLLSVVGWAMPVYALNWGKFPALFGLSFAPFVLALFVEGMDSPFSFRKWGEMLLAGGLLLWAHTRVALWVFGWALGMYIFDRMWSRFAARVRTRLWLSMGVLAGGGAALLASWGAYWRFVGWLGWLCVIWGWWKGQSEKAPALRWGWLGWFVLLLGALFPLPAFLPFGARWIDRPLFEMSVSFPLAWMGGILLARLWDWTLASDLLKRGKWKGILLWAGAVLMVVGGIKYHAFCPLPEAQYVQEDDVVVLDLLARSHAPHAVLLAAGIALPQRELPIDGGIWAVPLSKICVEVIDRGAQWWTTEFLTRQCTSGKEVWIYVDQRPQGFSLPPSDTSPFLQRFVEFPDVSLYKVDCVAVLSSRP